MHFSPSVSETPFGRLPVLTITRRDTAAADADGGAASVVAELADSYAIARYLARRLGLAGADALESAQLDAIASRRRVPFSRWRWADGRAPTPSVCAPRSFCRRSSAAIGS